MLQSFLSKLFEKRNRLKILSYRRYGANGNFSLFFFRILFTLLYAVELALSRWKLSTRWSKTAHATIGLPSRHRINPRSTQFVSGKAGECRWRPRRYQVDPWSTGREFARGVLRSSSKPEKKVCFLPSETDREILPVFLHSSAQMFLYQAPGCFVSDAWLAPATYHRSFCEHCDEGWVGAPNDHAPFRFHGEVVVLVDRCLSRTRNLAAST